MNTYNYMNSNLYYIKDNTINSNYNNDDYQINDFKHKENYNNLYFNPNNLYNNENKDLSDLYRNDNLTQAEKLLLGKYKSNYRKKKYESKSIYYLDSNNLDKNEKFVNNYKIKLAQEQENMPYYNYNDYYSLNNNYNYNQIYLLNNKNDEIPMNYLKENYGTINHKYNSINYPINNPIIYEGINNYNNESRGENYLNLKNQISSSQDFNKYHIPSSTN